MRNQVGWRAQPSSDASVGAVAVDSELWRLHTGSMAKGGGIKASKGTGGGAAVAPASGNGATFDALKRYDVADKGGGGLHTMAEARELSALKGGDFDAEMLRLYNADKIILHNHDYIANVDADKLKTFIKDPYGNHYHAWAIRSGN